MAELKIKDTMTSLEILEQINFFRAELDGKSAMRHKDLLDIIRDEFEDEIAGRKISPSTYKDASGKSNLMFILTHDQAKQIAMRESKAVRKALIAYIHKLEDALKSSNFHIPPTYSEALRLAADQAETIEKQSKKIEEDKPKVEFADICLKSEDNILIREMAKIISDNGFKLGERRLYNKLRKWKLVFPTSTEPYQKYIDAGYFVIKQTSANTPYGIKLNKTTLITPKGQQYIINRLKNERRKAG